MLSWSCHEFVREYGELLHMQFGQIVSCFRYCQLSVKLHYYVILVLLSNLYYQKKQKSSSQSEKHYFPARMPCNESSCYNNGNAREDLKSQSPQSRVK